MAHHFWDNPWFQRILIPLLVIVLGGLTTRLVSELIVEDVDTTTAEIVVEDLDKYDLSLELRSLLDKELTFPVQEIDLRVTSKEESLLAHANEVKKYLSDQGFKVKGPELIKGKKRAEVEGEIEFNATDDSKKMEVIINR